MASKLKSKRSAHPLRGRVTLWVARKFLNCMPKPTTHALMTLVMHHSLEAVTDHLTRVGILNDLNKETLGSIFKDLGGFVGFLHDLVEPENVIPDCDNGPPGKNPYNELDLQDKKNRDAIGYQAQRSAQSLVKIVGGIGRKPAMSGGLGEFEMDVSLPEDKDTIKPIYVSKPKSGRVSPPNETWLFINGISNEFVWFQLACDKISNTFQRDVRGVYNKTEGPIWDLIECSGERDTANFKDLVLRTKSSERAQKILVGELEDALWPRIDLPPERVVMVAHSQGCLLLRKALQVLVDKYRHTGEEEERQPGTRTVEDMMRRLSVFTFGNPSVDWCTSDGEKSLGDYVNCTEHFALEKDYVAKLGVLSAENLGKGYEKTTIFRREEGKGHLFGAHYPLWASAYQGGEVSRLLRAATSGGVV